MPPIPPELMAIPTRATSWPLPDSPDHPAYGKLDDAIKRAPLLEAAELFRAACVNDFYFFNRYCMSLGRYRCDDRYLKKWYGKPWIHHPWLFDRCRDIQERPNGRLRLWPRYYFKTTLETQNHTLWDFLTNPDLRVGIGTFKLDMTGEAMLTQIKRECEKNERLKWHFPGTFYWEPERESQEWSTTKIRFRQTNNSREPSIMIFSVTGALPTSFHLDGIVIDDLVTDKSIETREMIEKTTEGWRRTAGLGADSTWRRMVGTHWAQNDSYKYISDLGAAEIDLQDCYEADGETVVLRSKEWLEGDGTYENPGIKAIMGTANFAAQMRNRPSLGAVHTLDPSKLNYFDPGDRAVVSKLRPFLFADTSASRTKDSDYNALVVYGVGRGVPHHHLFLLDAIYDRLDLPQFDDAMFELARKWNPVWSFIEQKGAQRDVEHLRGEMLHRGFSFRLQPLENREPKESRILLLQRPLDEGRLHVPRHLIRRKDGRNQDLIRVLIFEQMQAWTPSGGADYDDLLDVMSFPLLPALAAYVRPHEGPIAEEEDRWARENELAAPRGPWDPRSNSTQRAWGW